MRQSIFHKLSSALWMLAVVSLVVLASYVSLGRLLSHNLSFWQDDILAQINARLPFRVDASSLQGDWRSFTPEIALHDLELTLPGQPGTTLNLAGGRIGVDVLNTLASRSLQVTHLQLEALELEAELTPDGKLVFPGFTDHSGEVGDWLQHFLLNIESLRLRDNTVHLRFANGERRKLKLDASLSREGSRRWLTAVLASDHGTQLQLTGNGLGDPFQPASFVGEAYAELEVASLEAARTLLEAPPAQWVGGSLHGQFWLDWQRGESLVDLQLEVEDLTLRTPPADWSVPLDRLALQGRLRGEPDQWQLLLQGGELSRGDARAAIPRLQVLLSGDQLQLRSGAWELQPLHSVLSGASLPERWAGLLSSLAPRGRLNGLALQTGLGGRAMAPDWWVAGNFNELSVGSWQGAPGVENASGYFRLEPGSGSVVVDNRDFSMLFPGVYASPLRFASAQAWIDIDWDSEAVNLRSGPVTAVGDEGEVNALFGLRIPLGKSDVGVEMDLLAGLRDSHPRYRAKYLPEVLHGGLRQWLADAVGDGHVAEAGFIWRGSLRADGAPLRTVQVMLNVEDVALRYQPDWPPLEEFSGTLLVDDTNVSVWSEYAKLYDSVVSRVSAEAWMDADRDMQLVVSAELAGELQDGMATVRESPLGEMTGGAFQDWRGQGSLAASLQLGLNLNQPGAAPDVDFSGRVDEGKVDIAPGNLSVESLAGEFSYRSGAGFSSRGLTASLWDEQLQIEVSQPADASPAPDTAAPPVVVDVTGRVAAQALQAWSGLRALDLASGETAVAAQIRVEEGRPPRLSLNSSLEGMALDLPAPWSKIEPETTPFTLNLPLGGDSQVLELALGQAIDLRLDLAPQGDGVRAVALGVGGAPPPLVDGQVSVTGGAPLLALADWQAFAGRYLSDSAGGAGARNSPEAMALDIRDFQVERLLLWGSEYRDVVFDLATGRDAVSADFEAPWAQGRYRSRPGQPGALTLDWIDPGQMPKDPAASGIARQEDTAPTLPDLAPTDIAVQRLLWKERELGELRFRLAGEAGRYRASNIDGVIAGLRLSPRRQAELVFVQGEETRLEALFEFDNLGDTLNALGYARSLETTRGTLDLAFDWPDSPQDFSLAALNGHLDIQALDGRFLETPGGTGALKVVEILNLAGVVQRLSLSHVFDAGITFDSLDGQVFFHPGTIELADLTVIGSSSAFAMSGVSDVGERSLDGELVATLPVASNLPWVAALAGGLPVAAGVFVVSKVFEKQVNRLSSGVYSIEGTWNDPRFTFDRIFDDELRRAEAPTPTGTVLADPNQPPLVPALDPNRPAPRHEGARDPNQPAF